MASAIPFPLGASRDLSWADELLLKLVSATIRNYNERPDAPSIATAQGVTEAGHGRALVRKTALLSAGAGATSGLISTGGAALAAGTAGVGALVAAPASVLGAAADTVLRVVMHTRMACKLADLFDLRFDPDEPADVWAIFSLALGNEDTPAEAERPGERLEHLAQVDLTEFAKGLGGRLFGASLLRSVIPVVGVISSSVTNYTVTKRLGETVRRYVRYRAAFDRVLSDKRLGPARDRLFEGLWFLFVADGRLKPEETALLSTLLRGCPPSSHARLDERLADPIGWYLKLGEIPEEARVIFYHALEIGAAVDKIATLRERKLLQRAAEALGLRYDEARLERMMRELDAVGMLFEQVSTEKAEALKAAA
ncbi:hypothetical protein [Polyangium aurulentum]|uniref:hypothetical protein n=1 Tax=Polyangium aurulentum TaxID=2567896 RepID=UPI0010AE0CA0|nr:hypothetical protein [Polyangium aurulentum]UQA55514.1 hypothetical protein E8A73_029725 [Polyangium aurulentum]